MRTGCNEQYITNTKSIYDVYFSVCDRVYEPETYRLVQTNVGHTDSVRSVIHIPERSQVLVYCNYTLFHEMFSTFVSNIIGLPERRNKRKSVLEITKMYYFKI